MKLKINLIVTILGIVMVMLTSCKKDEPETQPGIVINQQEVLLHSMIDNSIWQIDYEIHSHVELNVFYWDINYPAILEYKFYETDSVRINLLTSGTQGNYIYTQYTIIDNVLKIKFNDDLEGTIASTPDTSTIIIDFYLQNQTIKYDKKL